jgi:hypothetical protein
METALQSVDTRFFNAKVVCYRTKASNPQLGCPTLHGELAFRDAHCVVYLLNSFLGSFTMMFMVQDPSSLRRAQACNGISGR